MVQLTTCKASLKLGKAAWFLPRVIQMVYRPTLLPYREMAVNKEEYHTIIVLLEPIEVNFAIDAHISTFK